MKRTKDAPAGAFFCCMPHRGWRTVITLFSGSFTFCRFVKKHNVLKNNVLLGVDRGHQAPLAGLGGASDWQSLNYLSNITPQKADLNQGPWVRLEAKERELANRSDVTAVYSVTGPLFERHIATLPAAPSVEIPSAYWKIIFIGVSPDKGQYVAFLMDQTTPKSANFCDYQVTVDLIESKTNPKLTIWSSLPANVSALIKATKGTLANEMGCSVSTSI